MNIQEFNTQMQRLVSNFGKNSYPDEKARLIWGEVRDFQGSWLQRAVDRFIGDFRQAPLVQDFREAAAKERERSWSLQKKQHEQDAKDFYAGTYQPEEVRVICQFIIKRMQGGVSDEDWRNFITHLNTSADVSKGCKRCDGEGAVFVDGAVGRCICAKGLNRKENWPIVRSG